MTISEQMWTHTKRGGDAPALDLLCAPAPIRLQLPDDADLLPSSGHLGRRSAVGRFSFARRLVGCRSQFPRIVQQTRQDRVDPSKHHPSLSSVIVGSPDNDAKGQGSVPYSSGESPKVAGAFRHVFVGC